MVAAEGPIPCGVVVDVESYVEDGEVTEEEEEEEEEEDVLVQARREEAKLLTYNCDGNVEGDADGDEDGEGSRVTDKEERVPEEGKENDELSLMLDETDCIEDGEGLMEEEESVVLKEEEDDEFSRMSDKELNKKVGEFIWRLKTQIQLQAVRDTELIPHRTLEIIPFAVHGHVAHVVSSCSACEVNRLGTRTI
ncbi:hypothetical protein MLD38_037172 [Melastoma candidum]|uniref:Uncharacterized protein n=1 Tax=Melastoma candidum TaxID=119954 RepID=A0ACB9LLI0_9MYRT|nr:hypothetical protein MLD38_037172 [Melastoma candidum]